MDELTPLLSPHLGPPTPTTASATHVQTPSMRQRQRVVPVTSRRQGRFRVQARALAVRLAAQQRRNVISTLMSVSVPLFAVILVGVLQLKLDPILRQGPPKGSLVADVFDASGSVTGAFGYAVNWVVPPDPAASDMVLGTRNRTGVDASGLLGMVPYASFGDWSGSGTFDTPSYVIKERDSAIGEELLAAEALVQNMFSESASSAEAAEYTAIMPEGVLKFERLNMSTRSARITAQYGRNLALNTLNFAYLVWSFEPAQEYSRWISLLSTAFVEYARNETGGELPYKVEVSVGDLPYYALGLSLDISLIVAGFLFPLALTVLIPSFVYSLVSDKSSRSREMMRMNGMIMPAYWTVTYAWYVGLQVASSCLLIATGWAFQLRLFTTTPAGLYISLFLAWAVAAPALSILASSLFHKPRIAVLATYTLILAAVSVGATLNSQFWASERAPVPFMLFPPFALVRGVFLLSNAVFTGAPLPASALDPTHEFGLVCLLLTVEGVVFLGLGLYLDTVVPHEFGVGSPLLWPITTLVSWAGGSSSHDGGVDPQAKVERVRKAGELYEEPGMDAGRPLDVDGVLGEADAALAAARSLAADAAAGGPAVVLCNINKVYPARSGSSRKHAVKNLSLTLDAGQVLGFIGPNGSGKSTTIGVLTGLLTATHGSGFFFGHELASELDTIRSFTGVCPQFSILDPFLTVQETAEFYARIKGVVNVTAHVGDLLARCGLEEHASKRTSDLSGGMARRLSILIALLGDCRLVILDEPSTGVSVEERRAIWQILSDVREGKVMILTSHDMEEVELLSSRICLMSRGQAQCIGTQEYLKAKFGSGFRLVLKCQPLEAVDAVIDAVVGVFPTGQVESTFNGTITMSLGSDAVVSQMFGELESLKATESALQDYALSGCSLEDVFINIIRDDEADDEAGDSGGGGGSPLA